MKINRSKKFSILNHFNLVKKEIIVIASLKTKVNPSFLNEIESKSGTVLRVSISLVF